MKHDVSRSESTSVLTLRRGLAILDAFSSRRDDLGVNEIARLVDLHKSTVSRLCGTLEQAGYLERDEQTGKFHLGPRVFQLVGAASPDIDLRAVARPILRHLVDTCGDTVHLSVRDGEDTVTIEVVDGSHLMRMQGRVGQRTPMHVNSLGKAILASLPTEEVDALLKKHELVRLTPSTITDRGALKRELEEVRRRGYSLDMEELEEGLRCVGAPVRDQNGQVIAAISVSGPRHRFTTEAMDRISRLVRESADEISRRLGAPPASHTPDSNGPAHPNGADRSARATTVATVGRNRRRVAAST